MKFYLGCEISFLTNVQKEEVTQGWPHPGGVAQCGLWRNSVPGFSPVPIIYELWICASLFQLLYLQTLFEKVYSVGPQTCVMYVNHLAQYETSFGTLNEWQLLRRWFWPRMITNFHHIILFPGYIREYAAPNNNQIHISTNAPKQVKLSGISLFEHLFYDVFGVIFSAWVKVQVHLSQGPTTSLSGAVFCPNHP